MAKRFRTLEGALKYITVGLGTPTATTTPPVGSPLEKYKTYKNSVKAGLYPRGVDSLPESYSKKVILPFYFKETNIFYYQKLSERSFKALAVSGFPVVEADFNWGDPATDIVTGKATGYKSARAIVLDKVTAAERGSITPTDSKITGLKYKKGSTAAWTYPFGDKKAAKVGYRDVASVLIAKSSADYLVRTMGEQEPSLTN
jgi:hypothetical protein